MTTRDEKKRKQEQQIYDTAIDLFCEIGYKKTTLVDIAAEAGVSTRTLYRYYPTKESILRRFCRENIMAVKAFASNLDEKAPLRDRVLNIMVHDYSQMFCLFDPGHVLHYTRDDDGIINRFEIENIFEIESVYCALFKKEQLSSGIIPNSNAQYCASIIVAIYRHCNDIFRFRHTEQFDLKNLRRFYDEHLDVVWNSLEDKVKSPVAANPLDLTNRHLFNEFEPNIASTITSEGRRGQA